MASVALFSKPPTQGDGTTTFVRFEEDAAGSTLVLTSRQPDTVGASDLTKTAARIALADVIVILDRQSSTEARFEIFYLTEQPPGDSSNPPFTLGSALVHDLPHSLAGHPLVLPKKRVAQHLTCHAAHRLHVVVSTGSGTGQAEKFYQGVLQPLLAALELEPESEHGGDATSKVASDSAEVVPCSYSLLVTKSVESVQDLAGKLRDETKKLGDAAPAHTVILLSGDGGVVDMLNGLASDSFPLPNKVTIALLPLGTGNALFNSLHKPLYTAAQPPSPSVLGLRTLLTGAPAPLPTFRASFSAGSRLMSGDKSTKPVTYLIGAIVASYGFHASLVWESDTPAYRKHGAARFGMAAGELLKLNHAYKASVAVARDTGEPLTPLPGNEYGYILATLVSNLEQKFTISPDSKPLDGQLRLISFGPLGADKTMEIMNRAYADGKHIGMSEVGYDAFARLKVIVHDGDARWRKVCIDGMIIEIPQDGSMEVEKVAEPLLNVIVDRLTLKAP
jgi:diacylglycerol kinase family enzyme